MSLSTKFMVASITLVVALFLSVKSDKPITKCDAPLIPAKKDGIDDQYIVVLQDDATDEDGEEIRKEIESSGGKVRHHWSNKGKRSHDSNFQGFSLKVDGKRRAAVLRKAKRNCKVKHIEQDQYAKVSACNTQSNAGWCLSRIPQQSNQYVYPSSAGSGATVYVIDTGCNQTHPDISGRIAGIKNFCSSEPSNYDLNGHGTATVSLVGGRSYGAAKSATLYCLKAMNAKGQGSFSDIIAAVNYAGGRPDKGILSMSLGGGYSSAMNSAVQNAFANGHLPVVAAGNENQDASNVSPASSPNAITVAASDQNNKMASFTNYGKFIDIIAPGVSCNCARAQNNGLGTSSGTSISCPLVAGICAVIQTQNGWLSASDAPQKITSTLLNAGKNGVVGSMKPNTVNKLLFWNNCN